MKLYIEPSIKKLEKILQNEFLAHETLLHYTGSMYGIGCRVSSPAGIDRICKLKQRNGKDGLIVLIPELNWLAEHGITVPNRLIPLMEQYWPGNLSIAFKCDNPDFAHLAVDGKVAFRVPTDDLLRIIIDLLGEPIISTSINISSLPPENDLKRLQKMYDSWFDLGIIPNPKRTSISAEPSTLLEYVPKGEGGSLHDQIKCLREGSIPFYEIKKSFNLPLVMFVCTANICRSPIANYLFNHLVEKEGLKVTSESSGLMEGGSMISVNSLQLLLENGIKEAQTHTSQKITPDLINGSMLVLTMEERQRDYLRNSVPGAVHKIFTLNEYVGEKGDIADPYGSDLDSYRMTYELIENRLNRLIQILKQKGAI
ncbi:MAG: Sua5/YciO/YrdC/YwlC family protein [Candidatus Cloacimonetes bacterium]|nr:Sua5/YciO/YrdC/YwlC family protein [Candidatus Cloacimonadota bacterium]